METQYPLTDFVEFSPAELQQRASDHLALMQRRHTIRSFSESGKTGHPQITALALTLTFLQPNLKQTDL